MTDTFSPDYAVSRLRFREAAEARGARLTALPIPAAGPAGLPLTIDVACFGAEAPKAAVVVSSGLHGVEGYFGAAAQLAFLDRWDGKLSGSTAVILLHALNPYGFAWGRRVNEDNIDLNRNFLLDGQAYAGAPPGYTALDSFLNPPAAPASRDRWLFFPRAVSKIARHGMPALKNAVAGGQYDFPKGLFFGGSGPSATQDHLRTLLPDLLGGAKRVLHVDFHTGLGKAATYKLFVDHPWGSEGLATLSAEFGEELVEPWEPERGVSFPIRGGLGSWCKALLPQVDYDVLAAEFGTVHVLKVIRALHLENRAWHHLPRTAPAAEAARRDLVNTFAPSDPGWREAVVTQGSRIVDQALQVLDAAG